MAELETLVHGHVEEESCIEELNKLASGWEFFAEPGPYEWQKIVDRLRDKLHHMDTLETRVQDLEDQLDDMRGEPEEVDMPRAEPRPARDFLEEFRNRVRRVEAQPLEVTNWGTITAAAAATAMANPPRFFTTTQPGTFAQGDDLTWIEPLGENQVP